MAREGDKGASISEICVTCVVALGVPGDEPGGDVAGDFVDAVAPRGGRDWAVWRDGGVLFAHLAAGEKLLVGAAELAAFGEEEEAGRHEVEPVRRGELLVAGRAAEADRGRFGDVGGARHRGEEGRLVDDEDVVVLEHRRDPVRDLALRGGAAVEEDVGAGGENPVGGDGLAAAQHDLAVGETAGYGVGGVLGVAVALARDDFREEPEGGERRVGLRHADAGSAEAVARGQRRCELALFAGHSM